MTVPSMQSNASAMPNWEMTSFGAVADFINGYPFKPSDWSSFGLPIVRIAQMLNAEAATDHYEGELPIAFRIDDGDLLFSWSATLATVIWNRGPALLNQHLFKVLPKGDNSVRFLHHLIDFHIERLAVQSHGTTMRHIKRGDLLPYRILRPDPTEQSFIAAVLDTVDEAIAKTEAVIAKLRQVRTGLLHDLLTRGLDEHGQLRDPIAHPEQFQDSPLGRIPYTWRVAQLREAAEIASGVTLGRNLNGSGTLELPYLRVANVQDGYLDLADVKTVKIFPGELDRFRLRRGDVLMNEGGDYDKLGRGTVWEDQIPVCLHQNHVFRVRCRPDVLNCYFLAAVSGSEIGKRYFLRSSKQSTNLASINSTQLNAFEIPLPSLAEQEAIAKILKAHDDHLTAETRGLVKLHALKSGLMSDLLTGRVRVPESISVVENPS
jgi:type I restriction enzyme, S subunit